MKNKKFFLYILLSGLCFLTVIAVGIFAFISLRNLTLDYSRRLNEEYINHIETAHIAEMTNYLEEHHFDYDDSGEKVEFMAIDPHVSLLNDFLGHERHLLETEDVLTRKMRNILIVSILVIVFIFHQIWLRIANAMISSKEIESEERTRLMLDATPMICSLWDTDGNLLDFNQELLNIFNIKDKTECIKRYYDFIPEYQPDGSNSRSIIRQYNKEVAETGYKRFEWMYRTGTGEPLPAEITLVRVPWKKDWRIACYARDLRETRATENNLKRALALVEASPNMTVFFDADGTIEYMNPAVYSLSGFSRDELLKGGLELMFSPDDFNLLNTVYIANAHKNQLASLEMIITAKNGQKHDISFYVVSVQLYDGSSGVGLIGRDITELKMMQKDCEIAKDQAERALISEVQYDKAKSDFLSRVSHELCTPLNAIIGMTQMAKKVKKDRKLNQCCTQITEASERLLGLVNDILDMTGFDTDNFSFLPKPFSLRMMLDSVVSHVTQMTDSKKQALITDIDNGILDWVESDERRLKQVLMNLLSNAVKFTPEKGIIQLSARMLENNNSECTIRFEVIDNGVGISKEELVRLWQVFEQADNSITREHGGMGLGLPLARRIVHLMRGELLIESEPGKGSRFTCDVRLGVPREAKKAIGRTGETEAVISSDTKRILIVDDVDINREILFAMLGDSGVILDGACNGAEAVKMFADNKYDLVLMDLHMPVMDGFTAAKHIRASTHPWAKSVPIISVSAETGADRYQKCREAGISEHLMKPVNLETLFGTITKWIPGSIAIPDTAA